MKDDIIKWKEQYGPIYIVYIENFPIYYRTLSAWEIQSILDLKAKKTQVDIDKTVAQLGILSAIPDFKRPGSLTGLSQEIWTKSSLTDESLLEVKDSLRDWAKDAVSSNFNIALSSLLCRVLPSLDLLTLLSLPTTKLLRIAAIVERITDIKILDSGDGSAKKQISIKEGYGVDPTQAQQVNDALSDALSQLK